MTEPHARNSCGIVKARERNQTAGDASIPVRRSD
jgi:hypothetical protein